MENWHTLEAAEVVQQLDTDATNGLGDDEVQRRLAQYGPNALIERGGKSPWVIIWEQLTSIMVVVLIVAALISVFIGDIEDTIVILAIVILNTLLGFSQEYRAEQAMAALKQLAVPIVRVRRTGSIHEVTAKELVPGDIVILEAGNRIPADGRLLESASLRVQEAALTGESEAVEKITAPLPEAELPLGDRLNSVYMGTVVTYGRGQMVVVTTGMQTELGKIAGLIQDVESEQTPLQRRLDQLGKTLAVVALVIVTVVFIMGLLRGDNIQELLLTSVSLAVAAVPEGLPAVVTIALALGAQRMLKRKALIRKLPAVETLGSVTVICSDKTGTLTENRMTVTVLDVAGNRIDLKGEQAIPELENLQAHPALALLLAGGALSNDSEEELRGSSDQAPNVIGDPTEVALVVASERQQMRKVDLEKLFPRVTEVPFDSVRKRMSTVHHRLGQAGPTQATDGSQAPAVVAHLALASESQYVVFTKGAVDSMLEVSHSVWNMDHVEPLTDSWRSRILSSNDQLAKEGMRVLGIAFRLLNDLPPSGVDAQGSPIEQDLILIGMVGMIDPARPEVRDAVRVCKTAGVRPIMVTGDHPMTAVAIARELGIASDGRAITGRELDSFSMEELQDALAKVSVYARVSPEHKIKLVDALQHQGNIVAMTGDGVNDAPALKQADIGVAMGITGTDVAKEAADMVLQDDNFATIVAAVSEGRVIYANIRKFIRYILTGNFAEIAVMLLAPFLGMPLPLLPLQILWVNLVTDGLPALALGVEPAEKNVMNQPPNSPTESILGRGMGWQVGLGGLLLGVLSLAVGFWEWRSGNPDWQTMVFTTLTFGQMAAVLALRSESQPIIKIGLFSNKALVAAVTLTAVLQLAVIYIPFLQQAFETQPLTINELAISIGLSLIMFLGIELEKWFVNRRIA